MKTYKFTVTIEVGREYSEEMLDVIAAGLEEVVQLLTDQVTIEYHEETSDGETND